MVAIQGLFIRSVRSLEPTGPAASRTVPAVDVVVVEACLHVTCPGGIEGRPVGLWR